MKHPNRLVTIKKKRPIKKLAIEPKRKYEKG